MWQNTIWIKHAIYTPPFGSFLEGISGREGSGLDWVGLSIASSGWGNSAVAQFMVGLAQWILKEASNINTTAELYSLYVSYLFLIADKKEGKKRGIVQIIHTSLCLLPILVRWEFRSLAFLLLSSLLPFLPFAILPPNHIPSCKVGLVKAEQTCTALFRRCPVEQSAVELKMAGGGKDLANRCTPPARLTRVDMCSARSLQAQRIIAVNKRDASTHPLGNYTPQDSVRGRKPSHG